MKPKFLTFNGETKRASQWCKELGLPRDMVKRRLLLGWSTEKALTTPKLTGHVIHGMSPSKEKRNPTYTSYRAMMSRCENPKHCAYHNYGGRGITVSEELRTFEGFHKVLGDRPPGMTLGRIDNNKGYESGNVHWETPSQQLQNTRVNRYISFRGETKPLAEWSRITGIRFVTLWYRVTHGWNPEDALTIAPKVKRTFNN